MQQNNQRKLDNMMSNISPFNKVSTVRNGKTHLRNGIPVVHPFWHRSFPNPIDRECQAMVRSPANQK